MDWVADMTARWELVLRTENSDGTPLVEASRQIDEVFAMPASCSALGRGKQDAAPAADPAEVRSRPMARATINDLVQRSWGTTPVFLVREHAARAGVAA